MVAGIRLQGTDAASSGPTGDHVHAADPTTRLEPHRLTPFRVTNDVTPSPLPLATRCQLSGIADTAANRSPRYPATAISPAVTIVLKAVGHMPAYEAVSIVRPGGVISRVGVPQYEDAPVGFGSLFTTRRDHRKRIPWWGTASSLSSPVRRPRS